MERIKSALEIAMERTDNMHIDTEELKKQQAHKDAKILVNKFIQHNHSEEGEKLAIQLQQLKDQPLFESSFAGLQEGFISWLRLPSSGRISQAQNLTDLLNFLPLKAKAKEKMKILLHNFEQLCEQFEQNKKQLRAYIEQQLSPQLREKEELLAQQTGQQVSLGIESLPEFSSILQQQSSQLEAQFNQALQQMQQSAKHTFSS